MRNRAVGDPPQRATLRGLLTRVPRALRWLAGDPDRSAAVETALEALAAGAAGAAILAEKPGRRRLAMAVLPTGERIFVKHYPPPERARWRTRFERWLGLGPDAREWRMLVRLRAANVAVPEPLAHVALPRGDRMLVTRFVPGEPLLAALQRPARERRALLGSVGALVARLHAAGVIHRDLHAANILVGESGPLLLDLQAALPLRWRAAQRRDLGELDASLAPRVSRADRIRVAAAALGVAPPFDARASRQLAGVARAGRARARAHWKSRMRRSLRPGRQYARVALGGGAGLRLREVPQASVEGWLSGASSGAGVEVRHFRAPGILAALADALRGSAARRAWRAGHALRVRGIAADRPLAFLEWRRLGLPVRSALLLEPLPALGADAGRADPAGFLDALARLLGALHARDLSHGALDASALRRARTGELGIGGLDAVHCEARSDAQRLAELERLAVPLASWLAGVPESRRRQACLLYATRAPFRDPVSAAERLRRALAVSAARS